MILEALAVVMSISPNSTRYHCCHSYKRLGDHHVDMLHWVNGDPPFFVTNRANINSDHVAILLSIYHTRFSREASVQLERKGSLPVPILLLHQCLIYTHVVCDYDL